MKAVILAEKPPQARVYADSFPKATQKDEYFETQDRLFPGETMITYGSGHLAELDSPDVYDEKRKQWLLAHLSIFPNQYHYRVPRDEKKQFNVVRRQLWSVDMAAIAIDSDRERGLIAWSIIQQAGTDQGKTFKRLWIDFLEKEVVYRGFQQLRDARETYLKFEEAQTRQIADQLIGMSDSPLYSLLLQHKSIPGSFSLDRVQTLTLYMIYQLQEKIRDFRRESYFEGKAHVTTQDGASDAKFGPNEAQTT